MRPLSVGLIAIAVVAGAVVASQDAIADSGGVGVGPQTSGGPSVVPGTGQGFPSVSADWNGGFESGCSLVSGSGWDSDLTNFDHVGSSTTIERNIVGEGQCAAKFVNSASTHMTRAELERVATGDNPELTYEMLVYVPSGQTFPKGTAITQTKQGKLNGVGCYNGGWRISDGTGSTGGVLEYITVSHCTRPQRNGWRVFEAGPLPRDRWFALKVHEKFSDDPSVGFVEAWMDDDGSGPGDYDLVIAKTYVDNVVAPSVRMRIGSYRQATDQRTVLYQDGFRLECGSHC